VSQPSNNIPPSVHKDTNRHEGFREVFSPATGAMAYLTYARMVCTPKVTSHEIAADDREWVIFCITGPATVAAGGKKFDLSRHDLLYVPRRTKIEIAGQPGADLAFGASPADRDAAPRLIRDAEIQGDPTRCLDIGSESAHTQRRIHSMLDTSVPCSRLLAGYTVGTPGAWTSWPPHEHNDSKEEFYLFFDMPAPAFSTQYVYSSLDKTESVEIVRDGDCVAIPSGYHPTVAAPGFSTVFFWVMAAYDPDQHRDLKHGITIQPEYANVKFF
jgi:5-deoxy-glucuronate isomerase